MKKTIVAISVFAAMALGTTGFAAANTPSAGPQTPQKKAVFARQNLSLTQGQRAQISNIVKGFRQQVRGIAKSSATEQEKQAKIKDLRAAAQAEILALLTPDQRSKVEQTRLLDRLLSPGHGRHKMGMILKQLNLTDAQRADIKKIMTDARARAQAIRANTTLTQDQKRSELQQLRKATIEQIRALLTPEQQQKLEQMRKERPNRGARFNR